MESEPVGLLPMLPQPLAVITGDENQCAILDARPLKGVEESTDVPVHVCNLGIVRTPGKLIFKQFAMLIIRLMGIVKVDPAKKRFGCEAIQPRHGRRDGFRGRSFGPRPVRPVGETIIVVVKTPRQAETSVEH